MDTPNEPYDEQGRFRRMRVLSLRAEGDERSLATVLGGSARADFEIPEGLDPLLTLALGLHAGYPTKPPLPLGREVDGVTERLRTATSTTHCPAGRTAPALSSAA
jgi:hypothetical protein